MLLSVIIPAYNEESTIASIIEKVRSVELPRNLSKEVVIVDDGSKDGTREILKRFESLEGVKIVYQNNQGKTGALLTGIRAAKGDILLIQDADLEYDPSQYPKLLDPILNGATQVVYGSRFLGTIKGMEYVNRWANMISNWTFRMLFGVRITDINTCYKVFTRRAIEGITIKGKNFAFETEITVKILNKRLSIYEVPIDYVARSRGAGKKIRWTTAVEMYWPIIKYRFLKP